jgi:hypothetical protein
MRAFISTRDGETARLARIARRPHVFPLAEELAAARDEFERIVSRTRAHADRSKSGGQTTARQETAS